MTEILKTTESDFSFDELFFSRTNKKGVIESGNSVFQRVSQYDWDELLQKPHRIIRSPEMPRGVFHLLWDTILADKTVGAYVLNKAKDGSPYWVFALVTPITDGFLSVRLKPSSQLFSTVKSAYSELLAFEKTRGISPQESHELLLKTISSLGFSSYEQFMTEALMQELESRHVQLNTPPLAIFGLLRTTLESGANLQKRSENIFTTFKKNMFVPLNLEVQAVRIGQEAASIATISSQYDQLAKEIQVQINRFVTAGKLVQEKVQDCQFYICNSVLQKEIYHFFEQESKPTPIDKSHEMKILAELEQLQTNNARLSLFEIQKEYGEFKKVYENVRKLAIGLEMVSLSGKIEAAKLRTTSKELTDLLNELSSFKDNLKEILKEINGIGRILLDQTNKMGSSLN